MKYFLGGFLLLLLVVGLFFLFSSSKPKSNLPVLPPVKQPVKAPVKNNVTLNPSVIAKGDSVKANKNGVIVYHNGTDASGTKNKGDYLGLVIDILYAGTGVEFLKLSNNMITDYVYMSDVTK